jgi:ribosomal protein L20A (L18A)
LVNKVLITPFASDDIRFAAVIDGRLYTLILRKTRGQWYFTSMDPELSSKPEKLQWILDELWKDDGTQSQIRRSGIEVEEIKYMSLHEITAL